MSTLLYLLTLAGILAVGMTVVIVVLALFLWARYRLTIDAARHTDARMPAPTPARQFSVIRGRRVG